MQIKEVKVKFEDRGKEYSFDCSDVFVRIGNKVVVDTQNGQEVGTICSRVTSVEEGDLEYPLKKIIRIATNADLEKKKSNESLEKEIKASCEEMSRKLNLDMKVVSASLTFDGSKVLICFTAEDRVDFRELVRNLAGIYHIKIELKQIDAREETKKLGGLGPCGRECCCSKFLQEAEHSSIKMAKNQSLSLNPTSISGLCGKLKCCLSYENKYYSETISLMPKIGSVVSTPNGNGIVVYNNLLKKIVSVKFENSDGSSAISEFELEKVKSTKQENKVGKN